MTKDEVINDMKFRQLCMECGLNLEDIVVCDDIILLSTPAPYTYILLDKNYNIVHMGSYRYYDNLSKFIERHISNYCNNSIGGSDCYPFENFTLKQIIDISSKTEIEEKNHGNSTITRFNGELIELDKTSLQLLSYIKFLGEQIKQYFKNSYHMLMLNIESTNVYYYLNSLISKINECVKISAYEEKRVWPHDILTYIGQSSNNSMKNVLLYDISDLLMRDNGMKIKRGSPDEVEPIENNFVANNLSLCANNLVKKLEELDPSIRKKRK